MNTTQLKPTTARIHTGSVMPACSGYATSVIEGRIAPSGAVLGGLDVRDRADAVRTTTGFAATTPGPDTWSPPTG
jgi:hypothetical protein